MNLEQCVFGYLIDKKGNIASKKSGCIERTSSFPKRLIPHCHPQRNGLGIQGEKDWPAFCWKEKGGFSLEHHRFGAKNWMLISHTGAVKAMKNGTQTPVLQSHSLAVENNLDPLWLPSLIKNLSISRVHKQNQNQSSISLVAKDARLPTNWLDRVTPFLQCVLSGAPISWEDRKIPLDNVIETIQLVLLCLPSSMMGSVSLKIQAYTLYGTAAIAHGQHARKGVFFMKGSLLGAKKAGLNDCTQYLAKLRSVRPKSKKHLQQLMSKEFSDLPKSFPLLSWREQGPILAHRLSEKDTLSYIRSVLPKAPEEKTILSIRGMRSEVLGLLLKHKKQPWVFPMLEKTTKWKGAWLDHGSYGMILGAVLPKDISMFRQFVIKELPKNLVERTHKTVSGWLDHIEPEIWKEIVLVDGASWWEDWKQKNEISIFWCSLDPHNPKLWDHKLYRRLIKKEWSRKAVEKLVAGIPSSLESVFFMLVDQLLSVLPLQGIRLLEEGRNKGIDHTVLWERLHSPSLYMWKKGREIQQAIGESLEEFSELEVRLVLTFLEESFPRAEEIFPNLGAIAMQYFFGPMKLKSNKWATVAETVIKERMLWNPDAYFVHIGLPGIQDLYLEAINQSTVLPSGGTGALLWMLLKGQKVDDSIALPEGFIELCRQLSYPITLSQVDSAAVLYALVVNRNNLQRAACTQDQIQRMLLWYVQSKRVDAPLQWSSEPIWRFFPFIHDHMNFDYKLKDGESEFLNESHSSILRKFAILGLLLNKDHLENINFRPNHRFSSVRQFTHIIIEARAKKAAVHLGGSLWLRLSEDNREKLQERIRLKVVWWRRLLRFLLRSELDIKKLKRRSEVLEILCMEFNCLGEIVLAAQNESGNVGADT